MVCNLSSCQATLQLFLYFFLSQQQEKYHGEIGYINFVFIDFEKFFDHVLRKVTFRP